MVPTLNRWIRNYKAAGMQDQNPIDSVMSQHWSSLGTPSKGNHYESFYTESHNIDHEYLYLIDRDTLVVTSYIRQGNGWMEINPNNVIREKVTRF